jgi:predicted phage tail protein
LWLQKTAAYGVTIGRSSAGVPGAPSDAAATVSGSSVMLLWSSPVAGPAPTGYLVEAGSFSGAANIAQVLTGTRGTTFKAGGVPPGTYFVRLRALNGSEVGPPSDELVLRVGLACSAPPPAPASALGAVTGTTVSLSWGASIGATTYVIEAGSAPGASNLVNFDTRSTSLGLVASGVGAGTYFVRVRAANACGTSGPSNETIVTVGTLCTGPPAAPSTLANVVSGANVTLTWGASPTATSYVIEAGSTTGAGNLGAFDTQGAVTQIVARGIGTGVYFARVMARNACGTSVPSIETVVRVQ